MCYNVAYLEQRAKKYTERYRHVLPPGYTPEKMPATLPLFYFVSGFEHPSLPVVKGDGVFLFEWGLIPHWVKDSETAVDIRSKTLNAVGETAKTDVSEPHPPENAFQLIRVEST